MNWEGKELLIRAFLFLKNGEEVKQFLIDLMTEKEIGDFYNRLRAAEMLMNGDSYDKVFKETGLSSATIARVSKWVKGSTGCGKVIERIHRANEEISSHNEANL